MTPQARPIWLTQKERGSAWLMALIVRITLLCGRPAAAVLLYPICAYFVCFSVAARHASRQYLRRVLGRSVRLSDVFAHYHCFASTLLDRVFLHAGQMGRLDYRIVGLEHLLAHVSARRGCLLYGGHFGSFELLRALALHECPVPVRVLMHPHHAAKMARVLARLSADLPRQVIALGRPQTMLEVRAALANGEMVALLADRALHGDRAVECPFLGADATFPRGPFELAAMLDAPVLHFAATYDGAGGYEIRFDPPAPLAPASSRASGIDDACRGFAAWLEARCHAAPYNWFNFYDFWSRPEAR